MFCRVLDIFHRWRRAGRDLELERQLQECRLALAERDRSVQRMRADLDRARNSSEDEAVQRGRAEVEQLVDSMGASLVQLVTQAQLHRNGTVPVRVDDVVAVGTRLMRSLRAAGVDTLGELGEEVAFDPDRHDLLSTSGAPEVGVPVRIRMVGLSYQDRVLRRAGVEPVAAGLDS
jgi:molecular chaperone GrpE (heat shock protein)